MSLLELRTHCPLVQAVFVAASHSKLRIRLQEPERQKGKFIHDTANDTFVLHGWATRCRPTPMTLKWVII